MDYSGLLWTQVDDGLWTEVDICGKWTWTEVDGDMVCVVKLSRPSPLPSPLISIGPIHGCLTVDVR